MAISGEKAKAKIDNKVFVSPPASLCTITTITGTLTTGTLHGYDGITETTGSSTQNTLCVPYGYVTNDRNYLSFGLNSEGELLMAVKGEVELNQEDKIAITGSTLPSFITTKIYRVLGIKDYPYNGYNLARILKLKQEL